MKQLLLIFTANVIVLIAYSQGVVDFSKFPLPLNDTTTLNIANLLDRIGWQDVKIYCKTTEGHYASENNDNNFLTRYEYVQQGHISYFEIVSYKGAVLEYYVNSGNNTEKISYFDRKV